MTVPTRPTLAVIGSTGRMGAMLIQRLRSAGYAPKSADLPLEPAVLADACGEADIVLLCVPAAAMEDVVGKVVPHLRPQTILADIASVKELPIFQMERQWSGPVVGTHPLFGPAPAPDMELPVAVAGGAGAGEAHVQLVEKLFLDMGCRVFRTTAEKHDKAMAWIQGMNFVSSVAYFAMLGENDWLLPFVTPSFRRRLAAGRKMLTEDAELFTGLFETNPHSHESVRHYRRLLKAASGGDIDLLVQKAQWWWKNEQE